MSRTPFAVSFLCALGMALASAQATAGAAAEAGELATVRTPVAVMAGGARLPAGTYDVRLTNERPTPLAGQPEDAEQFVELVADGTVVAREVAEVLRDDDLPGVGASSRPVRSGARVELLKGGEFLRISVKREGVRYLIHLPVAP